MAGFDTMFRLDDPVDYDLRAEKSIASMAAPGTSPAAVAYDMLLERGGTQLLYVPVANFVEQNLSAVSEMIRADCALFGLSDAGAHCGAICDASFTTSFLTVWARDRKDRLPIEQVVRRITRDTARHIGWDDRGVLAPGMLADINVIDFDNLGCSPPEIVHDLPAGGRRLVQRSYGYRHTIKSGQRTFEDSAADRRPAREAAARRPARTGLTAVRPARLPASRSVPADGDFPDANWSQNGLLPGLS